jgi:hypothetical protein
MMIGTTAMRGVGLDVRIIIVVMVLFAGLVMNE